MALEQLSKWSELKESGKADGEQATLTLKKFKLVTTYVVRRRTPITVGLTITSHRGEKLVGGVLHVFSTERAAKVYAERHSRNLERIISRADFGWG